jgi:hypothetical protein
MVAIHLLIASDLKLALLVWIRWTVATLNVTSAPNVTRTLLLFILLLSIASLVLLLLLLLLCLGRGWFNPDSQAAVRLLDDLCRIACHVHMNARMLLTLLHEELAHLQHIMKSQT